MLYWVGVASREHVMRGVKGGFTQVFHGKEGPLNQMRKDYWIIYYSPTLKFGEKGPSQAFTAIGQTEEGEPYPYRRNLKFFPATSVLLIQNTLNINCLRI